MTLDFNKPIQTRDGRQAKFLHTVNNPDHDYPVFVVVTNSDGTDRVDCYTTRGEFYKGSPDVLDIVNVPEYEYKIVFKDGDVWPSFKWLSTKDEDGTDYQKTERLGHLKREVGKNDTTVFEPLEAQ